MSDPTFGVTFACRDDFDGLFSVATDNAAIVRDEIYHRFTNDSVLGDTEQADNYGKDLRKLLGSPMTDPDIAALGPVLSDVAQRSAMVDFADVTVTRISASGAPLVLSILTEGKADTGEPFSFVFTLDGTNYLQVGTADR